MHTERPQPSQLRAIEAALSEFRVLWAAKRLPFPCPFNGTRSDIEALDYLDYEGLSPPSGLAAAALVWGNVLARTGLFTWVVDRQANLMLQANDPPCTLVWPQARVIEADYGSRSSYGTYSWLLGEVVTNWFLLHSVGQEPPPEGVVRLVKLIQPEQDAGESIRRIGVACDRLRHELGSLGQ